MFESSGAFLKGKYRKFHKVSCLIVVYEVSKKAGQTV